MPPSYCLATCSRLLACATVVSVAACGDAIVGAGYQGEPMMMLSGQVLVEEEMREASGEIRVALFWSSPEGTNGPQHEQEVAITTSFPAHYALTLYTPPPDEVLYQPEHVESPVAIGLVMLYEDVDGDELFDSGVEEVLGGSQDVLVLFNPEAMEHHPPPEDDTSAPIPEDTDEPRPEENGAIEPGYHAVEQLGRSCDAQKLMLTVVDPTQVALVVGELSEVLTDTDCNDDLKEWEGL